MPRHLVKRVQEMPLPYPSPSFHELSLVFCAKGQVFEVMHTSQDRNSHGEGGAFRPGTPGLGCSFKPQDGTQDGEGTSYHTAKYCSLKTSVR